MQARINSGKLSADILRATDDPQKITYSLMKRLLVQIITYILMTYLAHTNQVKCENVNLTNLFLLRNGLADLIT